MIPVTGCEKTYNVSEGQDILFQYEYINYAWGYHHYGFIIDNKGDVLLYNNPTKWNFADKDHLLSKDKALENIANCITTDKKISKSELQKYINYIDNIASSKVTAPKNIGADAGTTSFICFQFSENTSTYKTTIIKREGDFSCENLNFYSRKVIEWMKGIHHSLNNEK
jgi:hypothetical protein